MGRNINEMLFSKALEVSKASDELISSFLTAIKIASENFDERLSNHKIEFVGFDDCSFWISIEHIKTGKITEYGVDEDDFDEKILNSVFGDFILIQKYFQAINSNEIRYKIIEQWEIFRTSELKKKVFLNQKAVDILA